MDFRRDAFAGIGDFENRDLGWLIGKTFGAQPKAQSNIAVLANALGGILDEVDQRLFDLLRIDPDFGRDRIFITKANVGLRQLRSKKLLYFAQRLVCRHRNQFGLRWPGEQEHIFDNPLQAADFLRDDLGIFKLGRARLQMLSLNEQPRLDGRERIADFVGDTGGEHAQRGQFFLAFHQRLAFDQFGLQWSDQFAIDDDGQATARHQQQREGNQQQNDEIIERFLGIGQKAIHRLAMGGGQLNAQFRDVLRLFFEFGEFAQQNRGLRLGADSFVQFAGGAHVIVVIGVD